MPADRVTTNTESGVRCNKQRRLSQRSPLPSAEISPRGLRVLAGWNHRSKKGSAAEIVFGSFGILSGMCSGALNVLRSWTGARTLEAGSVSPIVGTAGPAQGATLRLGEKGAAHLDVRDPIAVGVEECPSRRGQ